jgi:hypothetical protein
LTKLPTTVPTTQGFRAKRDNKLTNPLLRSHPLCACRADSFRLALGAPSGRVHATNAIAA